MQLGVGTNTFACYQLVQSYDPNQDLPLKQGGNDVTNGSWWTKVDFNIWHQQLSMVELQLEYV